MTWETATLVARMSEAISGAVLEWSRMSLRSSGLRTIHVIASAAKQSILSLCGEIDCFAALAMTVDIVSDIFSHSRGAFRPRFASSFALFGIRGRREDRVLAAPAVSCAICA